jgi:molecular chaperone GrpE (heat shock protein)
VKAIDALGADFDPNVHQAVMHEESPEHREGEVIGELRRATCWTTGCCGRRW